MAARDADDRDVGGETFGQGSVYRGPSAWLRRLVDRVKQGERYRACAYFLATIL